MKATSMQVGGAHYKSAYQPIEIICKLQLNFIQGNILKYLSRFTKKNGCEDLEKAYHYSVLGRELNPLNVATFIKLEVTRYCTKNELPCDFVNFAEQLCNQNWAFVSAYIENLKEQIYGK